MDRTVRRITGTKWYHEKTITNFYVNRYGTTVTKSTKKDKQGKTIFLMDIHLGGNLVTFIRDPKINRYHYLINDNLVRQLGYDVLKL